MRLMTQIRPSTETAIIEAAFSILRENPSASLADIAQRAGIGRATLHRHFASRDALMSALAKTALQELNAAIETATAHAETCADGLMLAMEAIIPLANRHWFLMNEPVDRDPEIAEAFAEDRAETLAEIEGAKAEGAFSSDIPTTWIAEAYDALIYAAWAQVRDGEATPRQAASLAWRTLTQGTGKPAQ